MKNLIGVLLVLLCGSAFGQSAAALQIGCAKNDFLDCALLGAMYDMGQGVRQNRLKAVEFYTKACDGSVAAGCYNLGVMYKKGEGVRQDKVKAVELYTQACIGGLSGREALGCFNAGWMYLKGDGVSQNKRAALEYFRLACDLKEEEGCKNYEILKNQGVRPK